MSDILLSGDDRKQELFLPKMLDEYVEEDNEARLIDAFVNSLDMKTLGFNHAEPSGGAGRAPYDPRLLLALFIWGYLNSIRNRNVSSYGVLIYAAGNRERLVLLSAG
ncbi:MAG: hypothetical protein ACREBS_01960 [Nitrososphaerales archaeon]